MPIDGITLTRLREKWGDIPDALIAAIDKDYGVYEGRTWMSVPGKMTPLPGKWHAPILLCVPLQELRASLSK